MIQSIYKYNLTLETQQTLSLPKGFQFISCQSQRGKLCIWYCVSPQMLVYEDIKLYIKGTGDPFEFSDFEEGADFLASIQLDAFVWHIFGRKR